MISRSTLNPFLCLAAFTLAGSMALAQEPAPPAPAAPAASTDDAQPPSPPARPNGPDFRNRERLHSHMIERFHGPDSGPMGGGFHFGPGGMWWKNPAVVEHLSLTPDQVKRMDDIFQESRLRLIDLKANVEKQEVMLEPMLSANPVDTAKAQAQIDKVADARAELEKANARMLLSIRGVLTPDQWTKLHTRGHFGRPGGEGQPGPEPRSGSGHGHGPHPGSGENVTPPAEP